MSLQSAPKTYAALLGSGTSTAGGLQTGRDLTRQLAILVARHHDNQVPDDIEAW